jgi:opacity protein-like surface antigen
MKKIISIMFVLSVVFFSSSVMAFDTSGIYVGVLGGYVMPDSTHSTLNIQGMPISPYSYDMSTRSGYLAGLKVGWQTPFTQKILAIELEYNHLYSRFDEVKGFSGAPVSYELDGKINMNAFMVNFLARYPKGTFHPYAGFGVGYSNVDIDDQVISVGGTPVMTIGGGSEYVFAYQLMAGFDVDVTKNIVVGVGYKFIAPQKLSYDSNIDGSAPAGYFTQDISNLKFQAITMGVSYLF